MANLEPYIDPTGIMTPSEVMSKNIDNIIEELNRNNDQLDNLNSSLTVAAYDNFKTIAVTPPLNGQDNTTNRFSFTHGLKYTPGFLCYIPGSPDGQSNIPAGFPNDYYIQLTTTFQTFSQHLQYTWYVGINEDQFNVNVTVINNGSALETSSIQTILFYILSNPAAASSTS